MHSNFRDCHCTVHTGLAGHAANAVIGAARKHGVFFAIFFYHGNSLDWAIFNTITARFALFDVDGYDEHGTSEVHVTLRERLLRPKSLSSVMEILRFAQDDISYVV
jgi:hypothetical protein